MGGVFVQMLVLSAVPSTQLIETGLVCRAWFGLASRGGSDWRGADRAGEGRANRAGEVRIRLARGGSGWRGAGRAGERRIGLGRGDYTDRAGEAVN
jgi:hypothetical protein